MFIKIWINEVIMIPKEVFHYTKNCSAIKILSEKKIRLGQFKYTNDPREARKWAIPGEYLGVAPITEEDLIRFGKGTRRLNDEINNIRLQEWKVLCVSMHHPQQKKGNNPFYFGNCRPNMWAHYGENHKGVCLKLNGKKLEQRIKELKKAKGCEVFSGEVRYNDFDSLKPLFFRTSFEQLSQDLHQEIRNHLKEKYREYFLLKAADWITEYEFRWLIVSREDAPEHISVEEIIDGVVIGENYPKEDIPLIKKLCQELEIKPTGMAWQNGIPYPYATL
jgi:hypothetical protein